MRGRCTAAVCVAGLSVVVVSLGTRIEGPHAGTAGGFPRAERMVVANRGSGSITVIDTEADRPIGTYALPPGRAAPEPVYPIDAGGDRVIVGDRANDRLVVFDASAFRPVSVFAAGQGVFHLFRARGQLWTVNDIDNTVSVFDLRTLRPLRVVVMPADLTTLGGRPHDVSVASREGGQAYVTITGVAGAADYVVAFDTTSFRETGRAAVGKDPHIWLDDRRGRLFVPCQGSAAIHVLEAGSLARIGVLPVPGAHGAVMDRARQRLYTTNLWGAGALFSIDPDRLSLDMPPVDTPFSSPHNIAMTRDGRKLYLTHSGAASSWVSVFGVGPDGRVTRRAATVRAGTNPFGITAVQ